MDREKSVWSEISDSKQFLLLREAGRANDIDVLTLDDADFDEALPDEYYEEVKEEEMLIVTDPSVSMYKKLRQRQIKTAEMTEKRVRRVRNVVQTKSALKLLDERKMTRGNETLSIDNLLGLYNRVFHPEDAETNSSEVAGGGDNGEAAGGVSSEASSSGDDSDGDGSTTSTEMTTDTNSDDPTDDFLLREFVSARRDLNALDDDKLEDVTTELCLVSKNQRTQTDFIKHKVYKMHEWEKKVNSWIDDNNYKMKLKKQPQTSEK